MRVLRIAPLVVVVTACVGVGGLGHPAGLGVLRGARVGANADPTVREARLLPEIVDETKHYGTEPGGGVRTITSSLRVITSRDGSIAVAPDRLPQPPQLTVALPERLGGGFLFAMGTGVWRADQWLFEARPIFTSLETIQAIAPGLDRVYLRVRNATIAVDGKSGSVLDLGPWPSSPFVSDFAAADGWRAAAIADMRGAVATFDAGATWHTLDLPMDPRRVLTTGDSLAVGGVGTSREELWFEVRADGATFRLDAPPREAKGSPVSVPRTRPYLPGGYPSGFPLPVRPPTPNASASFETHGETMQFASSRIFGKRPLAAAIEDGWPLSNGTAVVARDGALGLVRLDDGKLIEVAEGAFPLTPSRCHPVSLKRASATGAFGFVCGEPRGATILYAYDPRRGQMKEMKRFARSRIVTSSGSGGIAVRGSCAEDSDSSAAPREPTRLSYDPDGGIADAGAQREAGALDDTSRTEAVQPFCILGHDDVWREIRVRGDVTSERVVVLEDGRIVVLSPPQGQTGTPRLTLLDHGRVTTVPVVLPKVAADVARVLRLGVWLDGFEERTPTAIGGWIEAAGTMLGIEIALDGTARLGQFVRDAGKPFVSGRYGLGWTASRRGFETTDGGMTWTSLEVPEPLTTAPNVDRRACGPVGCLAAGWMRVGWGAAKKPSAPAMPPPFRGATTASAPSLSLSCEPTAAMPKAPGASRPPVNIRGGGVRRSGLSTAGGGALAAADLPPFFAHAAPNFPESERGMSFEVQELFERYPRLGPLARIYAWGPKAGDWDTQGKWQVKWLSPFAGWPDARTSLAVLPPQTLLDFTKTSSPYGLHGFFGSGGGFCSWPAVTTPPTRSFSRGGPHARTSSPSSSRPTAHRSKSGAPTASRSPRSKRSFAPRGDGFSLRHRPPIRHRLSQRCGRSTALWRTSSPACRDRPARPGVRTVPSSPFVPTDAQSAWSSMVRPPRSATCHRAGSCPLISKPVSGVSLRRSVLPISQVARWRPATTTSSGLGLRHVAARNECVDSAAPRHGSAAIPSCPPSRHGVAGLHRTTRRNVRRANA